MNIELKEDSIIVLVGAMGTGKSTLARKHFRDHHIVETDAIRQQLTGDFENQAHNRATFEILYATVEARAKAGLLTVIDSTGGRSVLQRARDIAVEFNRPLIAIKFPHLEESQLTKERMKHRTHYIDAYYRQVDRINDTKFQKEYKVFELSNIDDIKMDIIQAQEHLKLDSNFNYVVVPDIHGEYRVVENLIEKYKDIPNTKFIFLGDIVDRGESSYKTFLLVKELIESNKANVVVSNHDNKFYRWLKKWRDDVDREKYYEQSEFDIRNYKMRVHHGLETTVLEFSKLDNDVMDSYANDFINYYESLPPFLILEKDERTHYFVHAGISYNSAMGMKPTKNDYSHCIYNTIQDVDEVEELFRHKKNEMITIHIGHNYQYDAIMKFDKGNFSFVMNDIGIGKRVIEEIPDFMVI